jgi:hypothetical protein
MTPAHLVQVARQIEGEHHLFTGAVRMGGDDAHHGSHPFVEGTAG